MVEDDSSEDVSNRWFKRGGLGSKSSCAAVSPNRPVDTTSLLSTVAEFDSLNVLQFCVYTQFTMPDVTGDLPVKNLEGALEEGLGAKPKIEKVRWRYLTDPGENFGSLIMSVDVDVIINENLPQPLHLVAKMPPTSPYLLDLFNSPATFFKEIYFYRKIAPCLLEIQTENGKAENELCSLVPSYYGGRLGLKNTQVFDDQALILLENLNYAGYKTQDRIVGLDKEHMEFAIRELAKLHAIPIAIRMKKQRVFDEVIVPGLVDGFNQTSANCVMDMINKATRNLKNTQLGKKLEASIDKTVEHALNVNNNKEQKSCWSTLTHCDFWVNNMMFRYDDRGHVSDMKIVDFQLCLYDCCVDDLIFFLMSSARLDIIHNHLDDLIDFYYSSFISCLKSLNCETSEFTRDSFEKVLLERAPMKFPQCIMMVQVIKATRGSAPDVRSIDKKEQFLDIGKGQVYNEKLLNVLEVYHKKGWLKT